MWEKLLELEQPLSMMWLILSDFNHVKSPKEKQLGVPPTWYELKDFADCCLALGLHDAQTIGCYYTWYSNSGSNPVWCKLNRVLLNNNWLKAGLHCSVYFNPPGCLSDHSPVSAKEADLALQNAHTHLESNPGDAAIRDSLGDLRKKAIFLAEEERYFYYQKTKIYFLKHRDRNTKFFYDMVKRNAARNSILAVTKSDDSIITSALDIAQESLASTPRYWVPRIRYDRLTMGFLNGGPSSLWRLPRIFVGQSHRQRAVMDFFRSGRMLRQLNHTLLPSCLSPGTPLQSLITGRSRAYSGKRISPRCTINVDLRKAFNLVSWKFLSRVLHGYGFPPPFIAWIMECVSTTSFSVALNSSLHGFFQGKKGLKQGDPMSPTIFLLCMEFFFRLIKRITSNSDFNFHSKDVSGLAVNTSKLSIFTAGIQDDILDGILATTEFARGDMPVQYLSIPLAAKRLSIMDYSLLVDQIAGCIGKWTAKSLSFADRLELIRSVIQGVECFLLQVFPLPAAVIEKIHHLYRAFLWNSKRAPVAWEEISEAGRRFGYSAHPILEVALLARVLWNIHHKADTLWAKWVNEVCLRGASLWDWKPKKGDSPSFNDLPRFGTGSLVILDLQTQQFSIWRSGPIVRDL
ncbi:hypothetical protein Sango_2080700 [Sesamum angolense]|uniref:Reverse transcriptase domain-containing protein n=1 Tax=Sesamum angolense TaxID=2727404 RepID=A0AAE1WB54_9LAMI|nr:hypothetical protein Sango_2080700 [Sesamum angolense]